jgi:hypothetical protein
MPKRYYLARQGSIRERGFAQELIQLPGEIVSGQSANKKEYVLDSQRILLAVQDSLSDRAGFSVVREGVADLVGDGSENSILVVKTKRHVGTMVVLPAWP